MTSYKIIKWCCGACMFEGPGVSLRIQESVQELCVGWTIDLVVRSGQVELVVVEGGGVCIIYAGLS